MTTQDVLGKFMQNVREVMSGSSSAECANTDFRIDGLWIIFPDGLEVKYKGEPILYDDYKEHLTGWQKKQ